MEIHSELMQANNAENEGANLISGLKCVLLKLISPEFRLSDDSILQKLYDCISRIFSVEDCHLQLLDIFLPWIDAVIKDWKNIHLKSCSFSMRILSLICSNEKDFCMILQSSILTDVCRHVQSCGEGCFSIILAYLELMNSVISHQSGCLWILENGIWKIILEVARTNQSLYALRQAHNVIADLIITCSLKNVSACHCIIDEVFTPCYDMMKKEKVSLKCSFTMKSMPYQKECFNKTLNYLNSAVLLRETILKMLNKKIPHTSIDHIFGKYNLVQWICDSINNTENVRVMVELSRLLSALNISLLPHTDNGCVKYSDMRALCQQYLYHCKLLIKKKQYILVQEVSIDYFKLWSQFGGEVIFDIKEPDTDDTYSFENSIFIVMTVPLFIFIRLGKATKSDLMDAYAERIFGVACLQTKRVAYLLKTGVKESKEISIETTSSSTIHCFIRLANICKKEQAVMIFQTLVHNMRKLIPLHDLIDFADAQTNYEYGIYDLQTLTISSPDLLSVTLEALHCYISSFDISWSESLETLCIMPLLQKLLSSVTTNLTPRICVDALKVEKVVLLGYLPTNLALLMDTLQGSSVRFLGEQIFRLLHSVHWEVRDSALELLQAICLLAEQKLPAFQEMLLKDGLPKLLVSTFENDSEAYVRASALDCLCFMARMQAIWDKALAKESLVDKLLHTLIHDAEGIVRYKAVLLLKEIYACGQSRPEEMHKIMDTLYHVTLMDLHWEVKIGAILFWDSVLEKKLADVGMVDGNFPDHIFSGEKKKIIKLTPEETSIRIQNVFESLSSFGCLHALWLTVQDDCDVEVTREAGKLATKMVDLINKFHVSVNYEKTIKSENGGISSEMKIAKNNLKRKISSEENGIENEDRSHPKCVLNGLMTSTDEVIESIVSEGDINLICGLIRRMDSKEHSAELLTKRKFSLQEFYNSVVNYDIIGKQLEKARWLYKTSDGITSLLDDILAANQFVQEKSNIIDCY